MLEGKSCEKKREAEKTPWGGGWEDVLSNSLGEKDKSELAWFYQEGRERGETNSFQESGHHEKKPPQIFLEKKKGKKTPGEKSRRLPVPCRSDGCPRISKKSPKKEEWRRKWRAWGQR